MKQASLACLLVLLASCAMFAATRAALTWYHNEHFPEPMKTIVWERVPFALLQHKCAKPDWWEGEACSLRIKSTSTCIILSWMTEDAAHANHALDGMTVWDHEKKHCDGFDHVEQTLWSLTKRQGVVQ